MKRGFVATWLAIGALSAAIVADSSYFRTRGSQMGVMVIVAYCPRPGKVQQLLELTREHLPVLRAQGLATDRPPYAMRATGGTIVEVFEWKSKEAIASAHDNPAVQALWKRYDEACEIVPLASLKEAANLFAGFEPLDFGESRK